MSSIKFLRSSAVRRVFGSTGATKALQKIKISRVSFFCIFFSFFLNLFAPTCHMWRQLRSHFPENKSSARVGACARTCCWRCRATCSALTGRRTCSTCRWACSSRTPDDSYDDDDVEDDDDEEEDDDLLEHLCVELSVGARPHIVLVKCLNLVVIIKYRSIILDSITHVDVSKFQLQYISCVL